MTTGGIVRLFDIVFMNFNTMFMTVDLICVSSPHGLRAEA
jgi:hypothetical protein